MGNQVLLELVKAVSTGSSPWPQVSKAGLTDADRRRWADEMWTRAQALLEAAPDPLLVALGLPDRAHR